MIYILHRKRVRFTARQCTLVVAHYAHSPSLRFALVIMFLTRNVVCDSVRYVEWGTIVK